MRLEHETYNTISERLNGPRSAKPDPSGAGSFDKLACDKRGAFKTASASKNEQHHDHDCVTWHSSRFASQWLHSCVATRR